MSITPNLNRGATGSRFIETLETSRFISDALTTKPSETPAVSALPPGIFDIKLNPPVSEITKPPFRGGIRLPELGVRPATKTTTQIANSAISQLVNAAVAVVREAMNTAINADVAPNALMQHLERYTRVGEVLNDLAARWTEQTRGDFAKAFKTSADKTEVMDAIVSLAILNDADLEGEIRAENTPVPTDNDLMNRRIVWQSPPPGTQLEPPYVIVIAVEYTDAAKAQDALSAITGQLVLRDRFRLPRAVAERL